jgi:hypothetical protein
MVSLPLLDEIRKMENTKQRLGLEEQESSPEIHGGEEDVDSAGLDWNNNKVEISGEAATAESERAGVESQECATTIRKIMVSLPLLNEIKEMEIAKQGLGGNLPKVSPGMPESSGGSGKTHEVRPHSTKSSEVEPTRLSTKEIGEQTESRNSNRVIYQQLQKDLKSEGKPRDLLKIPNRKSPKRKIAVSLPLPDVPQRAKRKTDEEVKNGKRRKLIIDFPAVQPTTFDVLGSILDSVSKNDEKDNRENLMRAQEKIAKPCLTLPAADLTELTSKGAERISAEDMIASHSTFTPFAAANSRPAGSASPKPWETHRPMRQDRAVPSQPKSSSSKSMFHGRTLLCGIDVKARRIPKNPLYLEHPLKPSGQKEVVPVDPRLLRKHYGGRKEVKLRLSSLHRRLVEKSLSFEEKLKRAMKLELFKDVCMHLEMGKTPE